MFLQLSSNDLSPLLGRERLGSLDRSTNCTVDNELRKDTNSSGNTEENSVVAGLSQTIVLQKNTGVCIHVRVRVLQAAVSIQN